MKKDWLASLSDEKLKKVEFDITYRVNWYDGVEDDLYQVWKTLLELVWIEKKRRAK